MRLKVLAYPATFVLAVLMAFVGGLNLPESLLVGAWFTVLLVTVWPMPPGVSAASGAIIVGAMLIWGPKSDQAYVGAWTGLWLVLLFALSVATVWTWIEERRKHRVPTSRES